MSKYKYIVMCGGSYNGWESPRQLLPVRGEPIVARTIRQLRENGIKHIAISSNDPRFEKFDVPVLHHENNFIGNTASGGYWVDAFYPTTKPVCYLMGDVVFSDEAIRTIVSTETDGIEFFASAPPFSDRYIKEWAEPFAFKVADTGRFQWAITTVKTCQDLGWFLRIPIAWELWQVIKGYPMNVIAYDSYTHINDYTCDVDAPGDIERIETAIRLSEGGSDER